MSEVAVIAGAGPGNGVHIARRFAHAGRPVALLARTTDAIGPAAAEIREAGGRALALEADLTDAQAVTGAFDRVRGELGEVGVLVQNAARMARGKFMEVPPQAFRDLFDVAAMGMVYCCREVLPQMARRGSGSVILIGATAALRGGSGFSAFAAAKFAQRAIAQSLAREYGPQGVHVAHVVIDGVIDTARAREMLPDQPDDFFLHPADIAEQVFRLAEQPRSTWTHEMDLRPYGERF